MEYCVLDCSVAIAWMFEDEASSYSDSILEMAGAVQFTVPEVWALEVANVLLMAERARRINASQAASMMHALGQLDIAMDRETSRRAMREIYDVARRGKLTSYDAAYLELAMRQSIPIATLDTKLKKVAKQLGIPIMKGR